MGRAIHRLSAADLKRRAAGMYADGGELVLQATKGPDGQLRRSWIFRYTIAGRARYMGLGSTITVSLSEARDLATAQRKLLLVGTDPIEHRNAERATRSVAAARVATFDECIAAYLAAHRDAWRNEKHAKQWDAPLRRSISPLLGKLPVAQIDTPILIKALRPMWDRTPTTAGRVRGRIESILDWATVRLPSGRKPSALGWPPGIHPARRAQTAANQAPPRYALYRRAGLYGQTPRDGRCGCARASISNPYSGASGEARAAMWDEIDVGQKVWVVPAARTKAHREHRVPLSPRALEIANQMQLQRRKGRLVFPGRGDGLSVSEAGVRYVMQSLGCGSYTVHGFRSAFRDWCGEQTNFPREVAEAALAHRVGNAVEQAYARGDLFEKRARLMTAWAAFCKSPAASATVTPIRRA